MENNNKNETLSEQTLRIITRHTQCWRDGDLKGVLSLYHEDIEYFDFFNNTQVRKEELADYIGFSLPVKNQVTISHTDRIRVDGDTGFVQYTYSIKRSKGNTTNYRSCEAITVCDGKISRINEYSSLVQVSQECSNTKDKIGLNDLRLQILLSDLQDYFSATKPFLENNLDLSQVAKATGYSRNQISYALNQGLNSSFYEYTNLCRIEYLITDYLASFINNISDAAISVGFNSTSTFYKFFKQHTGLTPKAYIKQLNAPSR